MSAMAELDAVIRGTDHAEADYLLTVEQVATLAHLRPAHVRQIAKDESTPLREVRVGRYVRIPRSSYDAWLKWLAA